MIRDSRNSIRESKLKIFQKIWFLLEGTRAFGWKIVDILPILTQKTTDFTDYTDWHGFLSGLEIRDWLLRFAGKEISNLDATGLLNCRKSGYMVRLLMSYKENNIC